MKRMFSIASFLFALEVHTMAQPADRLSILCPPSITNWICGLASTARVTFSAPSLVTDCAGRSSFTCSPASGAVFPLDTTKVTCRATNTCGESAVCTFTVTLLRDTAPPTIHCASNITLWVCSNSVVVNYAVTATDNTGEKPILVCTPPSGAVFPAGSTTVRCVATDKCGNTSACQFIVQVIHDTKPPVITCPSGVTVRSCRFPAVVTAPITVRDDCDPNVVVTCVPPLDPSCWRGLFPAGVTTVLCTATDACGNTSKCAFPVNVIPSTDSPPVFHCPPNLVVETLGDGAAVEFETCDPDFLVTYRPSSGRMFPLGETVVHGVVEDECGRKSRCAFTVTVVRAALSITVQGSRVVICWPNSQDDLLLQWASRLDGPSPWADVSTRPVSNNRQKCVTELHGADRKFYRLRQARAAGPPDPEPPSDKQGQPFSRITSEGDLQ